MILLDTNVISELLRTAPDPAVVDWMNAQPIETLYLAAMTVAELRAGVAIMPEGKRKQLLESSIEHQLLPLFAGRILPFDMACTRSYAHALATARKVGSGIATADALIAAIALDGGFSVATRDESPFLAADVSVINPWRVS